MSIMQYNGGACVAMKGKGCVAIASDLRFGVQALTVAMDYEKVFPVNDRLMYGLAGLASDIQTVTSVMRTKVNMYEMEEERRISPKTFSALLSSTLYEKRFGPYFIEPVIAGLDEHGVPFISSTDVIGCQNFAKDFVVCGAATNELFGTCESFWQPELEPEDLFETISQALLNAVDRNAISGWGAVVHVITQDRVVTRYLKARQD